MHSRTGSSSSGSGGRFTIGVFWLLLAVAAPFPATELAANVCLSAHRSRAGSGRSSGHVLALNLPFPDPSVSLSIVPWRRNLVRVLSPCSVAGVKEKEVTLTLVKGKEDCKEAD